MNLHGQLLLAAILLVLNGAFVAAEFAAVAARRSQLEPRAEAGDRLARLTLSGMEQVSTLLACAQLGITICSLGLGALAEPAVAHLLEPVLEVASVPQSLTEPIAFVVALALVVYLHVAIGEMVPKNLALAAPEPVAVVLVPALVMLARALTPLIRVLNAVANGVVRLLGVSPVAEIASAYTPEQLQSIVDQSHREGLLDDRHLLFSRAIQLADRRARDVMVPWAEVVTVPSGCTAAEMEAAVARTGFSRFPVPVPVPVAASVPAPAWGYLHVKDLLQIDDRRRDDPMPIDRIRLLPDVDADDEVEDVLLAMRRTGAHLARVADRTDRTGRTLGLVFFEDLLEVLVGEVRDVNGPG